MCLMRLDIAPLADKLIGLALDEDLLCGDLTSELCIKGDPAASAKIVAKERLVVCGLQIVDQIFRQYLGHLGSRLKSSTNFQIKELVQEGSWQEKGAILMEIQAGAKSLLALERTILNFMQRLSGIATFTRKLCESNPALRIYDTRKTTPAWRGLEKYAVKIGGGHNHRFSLSDMLLVKNNHLDIAKQTQGSTEDLESMLRRVIMEKPESVPMQVEVRDLAELQIAIRAGAELIMLDNFSDQLVVEAIELVAKYPHPAELEVSGGLTAERLLTLSKLGVRRVSMGALTRSSGMVDISLGLKAL
jgi:nicotinate-nucleotide pyrophosphorylase (carboxylating)